MYIHVLIQYTIFDLSGENGFQSNITWTVKS